jgi:hypothetical protein
MISMKSLTVQPVTTLGMTFPLFVDIVAALESFASLKKRGIMGYRPDWQALEPGLTKMLEGIESFSSAVDERIRSNEFERRHIQKINDLRLRLLTLQIELVELRSDTW